MAYIAPIEKQFFRFKPDDAEIEALESLKAELYSDNFKVLSARYAKHGKRVVIVTDRLSASDREQGEIFSGEEYSTYENLLSYCLNKKEKAASVKEVVLFNWPFGWVQDEQRNEGKAYAAYWARLQRFIERAKPDVVIICGVEAFKYIRKQITRDPETDHSLYLNRVLPTKVADHKFDMVGTIDILRPCSWSTKFTKEFPNLLGYLANGIIAGMEGVNRWTISVPKPDEVDIVYVDTLKKYKRFAKRLRKARRISIDTEDASLARVKNTIFTFQFAWEANRGYLIPFMHPLTPFSKKEIEYIRNDLKDYFERGKSTYHIYQNGKFDITIMYSQLGVRFYNHRIYDVQAGEFALEENRKLLKNYKIKPYTLDFIAEQYGCTIYRETGFSKGDRSRVGDAKLPSVGDPIEKLRKNGFALYCVYDVLVPLAIVKCQIEQAKARKHRNFLRFVCEQLSDTIHAFAQMEATGQTVDRKHLFTLKAANGPVTAALQEQLLKFRKSKAARKVNARLLEKQGVPQGGGLFGTADTWLFDVTNTQCQQELFFKELGLKSNSPRADGKGFKVDKIFQEDNKGIAEVALFNRYKKLVTIRDTFVNGIFLRMRNDPDAVEDGRIRGRYGYNDVVTGRTSVSDPNTQNIPNRGDLAKLIKRLFIASRGCLFVKNDYSAHEVRDWANEAHDSRLAQSFYVGLKMRQELRILAYTHTEEANAWTKHKEQNGWGDIKDADGKKAVIAKVNNKWVRRIAEAELALEMKGDVHKNNCEIFYKVPVLEVTDDQRQDIKALVFGTIYGKTPAGLATTLKKTEEYAQGLQDTLFTSFPDGANWLKDVEAFGAENYYVESPLGMQRHLWGYLHTRKAVKNAMNRRGPNSIIQGVASCIGISSIRIMQKLIWNYFVKHDVPFYWRSVINYVHDSVESETQYHLIPIYLYLIEHASTTLIHRRYRKLFNYDMTVGLELEFQMGPTMDTVKKWNFMEDSLFDSIEKGMKFQKETLGYKPDFSAIDKARENWYIIRDLRTRELKETVGSKKPGRLMLLNESNARNVGFTFQ